MAYSLYGTPKHGKYTEKLSSTALQQVYLETGTSQVLTEAAITIAGSTYAAGTELGSILTALNAAGGTQYSLVYGATSNIVKLQQWDYGTSSWIDVSSITINDVEYAAKIGTASAHPSIGGTTQPVYVSANGQIYAATAYSQASVLSAQKDGSGNDIASTYATISALESAIAGITTGYVTDSTKAPSALVKNKTASQQTATLTGAGTATITLLTGTVSYEDLKVGDNVYLTDDGKCDWFLASKTGDSSSYTLTFYSIEADSPSLSGYVTASGTLTASKIILGNGSTSIYASNVEISSTALAYNATGDNTHILTGSAVAGTVDNRIGALDVSNITGFGPGKTLSTLTETDGKISATFQDISISIAQITDFPSIPSVATGTAGQVYGWDTSNNPEAQSIYAGTNAGGTSLYASRISSGVLALPDTGISSNMYYTAIQFNTKGLAVGGGQIIRFASSLSDTTTLDSLVDHGVAIIYE